MPTRRTARYRGTVRPAFFLVRNNNLITAGVEMVLHHLLQMLPYPQVSG